MIRIGKARGTRNSESALVNWDDAKVVEGLSQTFRPQHAQATIYADGY